MRLRRMIAVWAAKLAEKISVHIFHRQGVTWAGKIALRLDPSILRTLASQVKKDIFIVCGTNGKTTTNNMLCAALEAEGYRVVCNHTGSNMVNGVAAAFALAAGLGGNLKADYACIEIDEASTRRVFPHFKPDYAPEYLMSVNYICHLAVFRRSLFEAVGGERAECDGAQDHDLFLSLIDEMQRTDPKAKPLHLAQVLYYWRVHAASTSGGTGAKPYVLAAALTALFSLIVNVAAHFRLKKIDMVESLKTVE